MIDLAVDAPCAAGAALTIHHEGLVVRVAADAEGRAALRLPALAATGRDPGRGPRRARPPIATAAVPDLAALRPRRPAVAGRPPAPSCTRASSAPPTARRATSGPAPPARPTAAPRAQGGFLVRLGDPGLPAPMMAEVYTFPTGASRRAGAVDLTVEAQVSAATCGRDLLAQTIQISPGAAPPRPSTSSCRCRAARPTASGWCSTRCSRTSRSPPSEPALPDAAARRARGCGGHGPPPPRPPRCSSAAAARRAGGDGHRARASASRGGSWASTGRSSRSTPPAGEVSRRPRGRDLRGRGLPGPGRPAALAPRRATRASPPWSCPP